MSANFASPLEKYFSSNTNKFFINGGKWAGTLSGGVLKLGQSTADLGKQISILTGNTESAAACKAIETGFSQGRTGISVSRFIFSLHKLFTLQTFWETNSTGWRRVEYQDEKPIHIDRKELGVIWVKNQNNQWENRNTKQVSSDGKYIEDPSGGYVRRDWLNIAMEILSVIGRLISPVRWLHNLGVYDLGVHAKNLGHALKGIWGVVLSIDLVLNIKNLVEEVDVAAIRKRMVTAIVSFFDLITLPFEFGLGAANPALAITGAVLNVIGAGIFLFHRAAYY